MAKKFGTVTKENYPSAIETVRAVKRKHAANSRICTAAHTVSSSVFVLLMILYSYGLLYTLGGDDDRALMAPLSFLLPLWTKWVEILPTVSDDLVGKIISLSAAPIILPFLAAVPAAIIAAVISGVLARKISWTVSDEITHDNVEQLKAELSDSRKLFPNLGKIHKSLRIVFTLVIAAMLAVMLFGYSGQDDFFATAVGMIFCLLLMWFTMWVLQTITDLPVQLLYKKRIYNGDLFGELDTFSRKLKREEDSLAAQLKKQQQNESMDRALQAMIDGDYSAARNHLEQTKGHALAPTVLTIVEQLMEAEDSLEEKCHLLALLKRTVLSDTDERLRKFCADKAAEVSPIVEEGLAESYEEGKQMLAEQNPLCAVDRLKLASVADYKNGKLYYALAYLTGYNNPKSYKWIYEDLKCALDNGIDDPAMEEIARSSILAIEGCWIKDKQNATMREASIRAAAAAEVAGYRVCNCVNYVNGRCALTPMTLPLCWLDDRQNDWWMCKDFKAR